MNRLRSALILKQIQEWIERMPTRHKSLLDAETTLCHRKHVELGLKEQASYQHDSGKLLQDLVVSSSNKKIGAQDGQSFISTVSHPLMSLLLDERQQIISWLSPVDSSEDLLQLLRKKTPDTGRWILDHPIFLSWLGLASRAIRKPLLWICGAPGSGKTMLSASIADWLGSRGFDHEKDCVCYFHCDYRDTRKTSLLAIVRSLITQMMAHLDQIPQELRQAHENAVNFGRNSLSTSDRPLELMKIIGRLAGTYLIIDGLDECEDPPEVANTFKVLAQSTTNVRIMCVSRELPSIRKAFQDCDSLKLIPKFMTSDIDKFLRAEIKDLSHHENSTQDELFATLSARADGMFLWARLMVDNITSATSSSELSRTLEELPLGLNEAYQQAFERLDRASPRLRTFAITILSWTCCSARPMTAPELQDALSWDDELGTFSEAKKPYKEAIVGACSPLVEHIEASGTLRLVHLSVQDFLCNRVQDLGSSSMADTPLVSVEQAHCNAAKVCIEYLCLSGVAGVLDIDPDRFPFADYATLYWCQHLVQSPSNHDLYSGVMQLMSVSHKRRTWIRRYMRLKRLAFPLQELVRLHKTVTDWMHSVGDEEYTVDDIADFQHFLFDFECAADDRATDFSTTSFERVLFIRDLAREYTRRGRLDQGIDWLTQCLAAVEHAHGPDSTHSTWLLNSLGILYDQQDNTELAIEVQLRALRTQEAIFPHDHLDISLTVNELGRVYRHVGRYKEAEEMHLRALSILRTTLSDDDLQIIWTQNTLARSYLKQNRIQESITLHEQALAGQQRILGKEHPHALWTLTDIARCYCGRDDFTAALAVQREVVEVRVKVLGTHHADTLWSMNSAGLLLEKMGRVDEARWWHARAREGQMVHLGAEHKHTVWSSEALERLA